MTPPVEIMVRRFVCPFCHRARSKRPAAQAHIDHCYMNPAQRSCRTCANHLPAEAGTHHEPGWPEACDKGLLMTPEPDEYGDTGTKLVRNCPGWEPADWLEAPA